MGESARNRLEKAGALDSDAKHMKGRAPHWVSTVFGLGLLVAAGVVAWVLYIKYSL